MTTCTHTLKKILLNNCEFYEFKLLFQRKASQLCTCVWGSRRRVRCSRRWLGGAASARSHQVRAATGRHHSHASPTNSNHAGFLYKLELCHRLWHIPPHRFVTGMTAKSNNITYNNSFHTQVIEQKPFSIVCHDDLDLDPTSPNIEVDLYLVKWHLCTWMCLNLWSLSWVIV